MTSFHTCDVVEVKLEPHPNADSLSLVRVDDYQCAVRTDDWNDGDLGVYIPPDSIVPETEPFAFLGKHRRIKAKRLRGEWSMGLLIHAPPGANLGDDCMEQLGIEHYEPEVHGNFTTGGDNVTAPNIFVPTYDVMNFRKYARFFEDGEEVIVTEKIHGSNARFVCTKDVMYCGSRKYWKKEDPDNMWWKALNRCTVLDSWLRHHEDLAVYGEVFGNQKLMKYGLKNGVIDFAAFDILAGDRWLDYDEAHTVGAPLPWVPLIYRGPFDKDMIMELAEGNSRLPGASHYLEGVVVKPVHERTHPKIGRVQLKVVGNRYLSKS